MHDRHVMQWESCFVIGACTGHYFRGKCRAGGRIQLDFNEVSVVFSHFGNQLITDLCEFLELLVLQTHTDDSIRVLLFVE